jgi:hypothetical protein
MELNLSEQLSQIITIFILLIAPLIILLIGVVGGIQQAWLFLLGIIWFGLGIMFYNALELS